jgi:heat shock protein HtpX
MAATIASAVVLLSRWAMFFGGNEDSGMIKTIAVAVVAQVAATLIQMAISRSREYETNAGGAKVLGKPEARAGALAKLARAAEKKPMGYDIREYCVLDTLAMMEVRVKRRVQ